ncbi:hypothetical protein Micbo1qcDRAFT_176179 [Microdochium bolleyi]|uniref:Uncharacterized protein n=1 Tax=Microdochium bolleyi TaxID=196109 RepID=A0A136IZG4_9PEZI|nr:hypothetical protein Micbo1qcDRAFT_176179 [Microdochium bolleyi]
MEEIKGFRAATETNDGQELFLLVELYQALSSLDRTSHWHEQSSWLHGLKDERDSSRLVILTRERLRIMSEPRRMRSNPCLVSGNPGVQRSAVTQKMDQNNTHCLRP